jgi:hypothetical protein
MASGIDAMRAHMVTELGKIRTIKRHFNFTPSLHAQDMSNSTSACFIGRSQQIHMKLRIQGGKQKLTKTTHCAYEPMLAA